jgi:hypothetical protein
MEGGTMTIPRFEFEGLHGRKAACGFELRELPTGRAVVKVSELADNPGVSVTNFAEGLASIICNRFGIDPADLVWIEHYPVDPCPVCDGSGKRRDGTEVCRACDGRGQRREAASYDLVTFDVKRVRDQWVLSEPNWRLMKEEDWRELRLEPRQ